MDESFENVTIGDYTYACQDLNTSLIGNLVQNQTVNGTSNGPLDLAVLVGQCNVVCQLAWGIPNPDLSGIGVRLRLSSGKSTLAKTNSITVQTVISYMMQAILIALFGLYLIIPGLLYRLGFKYPERIHRNFRAANLLMSISFFVAEFSHLIQTPGIVERDFMRMLADLQIMQYTIIAYGVVAALGVFGQKTSYLTASQLILGGDNWRILDLAPPTLSIVYLAMDESNYGDPNGWQQTVAKSCPHTYETGMRGQQAFNKLSCYDVQNMVSTWLFYAYAGLMGFQLICGVMFGVCWYGSKWVTPAGEASQFRQHIKRHKWWYRGLPKLGLVMCILLTAAMVISVWIFRFCVDKVVDKGTNQDSQWSIGQVLAPAAWVPSILDIATWMYGCFRGRGKFHFYAYTWVCSLLICGEWSLGKPANEEKSRSNTQHSGVPLSSSGTTSPAGREGTEGETKGTWV